MKTINVSIFCDEIKNEKLDNGLYGEKENWDYIGICIVPTKNISSLVKELNDLRCGAGHKYTTCENKCCYHEKNKVKIHYQEYDNTNNFRIAERWCDVILANQSKNARFYMNILGINKNKLDKSYFKNKGEKTHVNENIYNRFFRTTVIFALKKFFSDYDKIIIDAVYHDTGNMNYHEYFKTQPLRYINLNEKKIVCKCLEINFIETNNDNCLNDENVLLQLVDLFLGANFNILHNSSRNKNKVEISKKLFPITKRLIGESKNVNGRYYNTYSMSFFPKHKITSNMSDFEREIIKNNNFYVDREMKFQRDGQLTIFEI